MLFESTLLDVQEMDAAEGPQLEMYARTLMKHTANESHLTGVWKSQLTL